MWDFPLIIFIITIIFVVPFSYYHLWNLYSIQLRTEECEKADKKLVTRSQDNRKIKDCSTQFLSIHIIPVKEYHLKMFGSTYFGLLVIIDTGSHIAAKIEFELVSMEVSKLISAMTSSQQSIQVFLILSFYVVSCLFSATIQSQWWTFNQLGLNASLDSKF